MLFVSSDVFFLRSRARAQLGAAAAVVGERQRQRAGLVVRKWVLAAVENLEPLRDAVVDECCERLVNTDGGLGGRGEVLAAELAREDLSFFVGDDAAGRAVALVADEDHRHVLRGEALDVLHPRRDVLEGLPIGHIEDQHDSVTAAIVRMSYSSESLLSGGIPCLKFDDFQLALKRHHPKIASNRGEKSQTPRIVAVSIEETRFAATGVSNQNRLDDNVLLRAEGVGLLGRAQNGLHVVWMVMLVVCCGFLWVLVSLSLLFSFLSLFFFFV